MAAVAAPVSSNIFSMGGQNAPGAPQFASLYVGDLDKSVTEAILYDIFNSVGPVASIRVCRDSISRSSLGYAYVNFHALADAERALDTLNYSKIKDRCCRIMWSHRDPNLRKSGSGNVFVKNLDKNLDNKALYDTFSLFGNILSCKVSTDDSGKSNGYGFVHYETLEAAKLAVEKVNGMQIGDRSVFVGLFVKRHERDKPEVVNFTNLYVKNFPDQWKEEDVKKLFQSYGSITSLAVKKDKKGRKFAFVNMTNPDEAKRAIKGLHCSKDYRTTEEIERTKDMDPVPEEYYKFYCQRAQLKSERTRDLTDRFRSNVPGGNDPTRPALGVNLYVKNLDENTNDDGLERLFSPFGPITSAKIMTDDSGNGKGFGFVCFKSSNDATKAVSEMHLKVIGGKPIYVGLAEKKEERMARLSQRYRNTGGPTSGPMMGNPMVSPPGAPMPYPNMPMKGNPNMKGGPMMGMPAQMPMQGKGMGMFGMQPGMYPGMMQQPMGMFGKGMPMMPGKGMPMMQRPPMNMAPGGKGAPPRSAQQQSMRLDEPLSAAALAAAPPGLQKQMLGERLFPRISRHQPELAGKITGMMLEMDNSELLMLLESDQQLKLKVDEALKVLESMGGPK